MYYGKQNTSLKLANEEARKRQTSNPVVEAAGVAQVTANLAAFLYEEALGDVQNTIAKPKIIAAAAQVDKVNRAAQYAYDITLLQMNGALVNKPISDLATQQAAEKAQAKRLKEPVNILFLFGS